MLQVNLVIEDAKISLEELQEEIQEIEEYVQSTDVAGESFGSNLHLSLLDGRLDREGRADLAQLCKSSKRARRIPVGCRCGDDRRYAFLDRN